LQGDASGAPRLAVAGGAVTAPARSGVYFLLRGAERAGALVVNAEAEESRLARLTDGELAARIGAREVTVAGRRGEAPWPAAAFASSTRRPLVTPLLLLALALLLAETALTRATRAPARPGSSAPARADAA
jgi:hypothetical protein